MGDAKSAGEARGSRYAAFISYSHADDEIAAWLQRRLEHYQVPASLVGRPGPSGPLGKRLGKVFRDRVELSAAHDLGAEIRKALENADALIVLCSPRSAGSRYVHEEIRTFKELGRGDRIFAAIVDGEPHAAGRPGHTAADECFPAALIYRLASDGTVSTDHEPVEPIAADFRKGKDGKENGALKLIAGQIGVGLDELVQRERQAERQRRRRANLIAAAMTVLALGAAAGGAIAWQQQGLAEKRKIEADQQRGIAENNAARARRTLLQTLAAKGNQLAPEAPKRAMRYALVGVALSPAADHEPFRSVLAATLYQPEPGEDITPPSRNVLAAQFTGQGDLLIVTGGRDQDAEIWTRSRKGELRIARAYTNCRGSAAVISADAGFAALGDGDDPPCIVSTGPAASRSTFEEKRQILAIASGGQWALADTDEGALPELWRRDGDRFVFHQYITKDFGTLSAAFSLDGRKLVVGALRGGGLFSIDQKGATLLGRLPELDDNVFKTAFAPDGTRVATAPVISVRTTFTRIFRVSDHPQLLASYKVDTNAGSLSFSADNSRLMVTTAGQGAYFIPSSDGVRTSPIGKTPMPQQDLYATGAISADGRQAVMSIGRSKLYFWNLGSLGQSADELAKEACKALGRERFFDRDEFEQDPLLLTEWRVDRDVCESFAPPLPKESH